MVSATATATSTATADNSNPSNSNSNNNDYCYEEIEIEIRIPGPFVVLQGNAGDGLSNTIDGNCSLIPDAAAAAAAASAAVLRRTRTRERTRERRRGGRGREVVVEAYVAAAASNNSNPTAAAAVISGPRFAVTAGVLATATAAENENENENEMIAAEAETETETETAMSSNTSSSSSSTTTADDYVVVATDGNTTGGEQQQQQSEVDIEEELGVVELDDNDRIAIEEWKTARRRNELQQRCDWEESLYQGVPTELLDNHVMMNTSINTTANNNNNNNNSTANDNFWWQRNGEVAVLRELPTKLLHRRRAADPDNYTNSVATTATVVSRIGTLSPGSTIVATDLIELNSNTLLPITSILTIANNNNNNDANRRRHRRRSFSQGRTGIIQMIKLETKEGRTGYACLSLDGYPLLAPGLPTQYVNPGGSTSAGGGSHSNSNSWIWRVTCPSGAFVREGLDLNTRHTRTLPYGSLIHVTRRCINNQGLSRLRTSGYVTTSTSTSTTSTSSLTTITTTTEEDDENNAAAAPTATAATTDIATATANQNADQNSAATTTIPRHNMRLRVDGWCSELLNPLSGQRGIVAQPLPFPVPAVYRVTLPIGAVIRKDVELSSPQTRLAPFGSIVKVVARAFSEHPVDKCIERLKLAGNGGWISVRLNRPPPHDDLVVELVTVDGEFDPENPGLYHLNAQRAVLQQRAEQREQLRGRSGIVSENNNNNNNNNHTSSDLSSVDENELSQDIDDHDEDHDDAKQKLGASPNDDTFKCVVCLTSERNATIVHGETGHVVCCLVCARILKARGDNCPVCRLPIDIVIQQFYA